MEWEQIDAYHQRAKVFGGWLVKAFENVMTLIQNAVEKLEEDIKASIIKEAANKLIDELQDKVAGWD